MADAESEGEVKGSETNLWFLEFELAGEVLSLRQWRALRSRYGPRNRELAVEHREGGGTESDGIPIVRDIDETNSRSDGDRGQKASR